MKWPFSKLGIGGSKKAWLIAAAFMGLSVASAGSLISPQRTSADTGQYNILQLVGEHCHDLHDLNYSFLSNASGSVVPECSGSNGQTGWQEELNSSLGCSSGMFYKHDFLDPHDSSSVTKSLWYTKQGDYKACYEKAQTYYNSITNSADCKIFKDGSDNYNKCTGYQDSLHSALGCDSKMFQTANGSGKPAANGDYWVIKPNASKDCQQRIDDVGKIHIVVIGSDGKAAPNPDPVSSSKVSDTSGTDSTDGTVGAPNCDESSNPLTWIICPVINDIMEPAIDLMDSLITQQLVIQSQNIFCGSSQNSCEDFYSAWATFRNLALGLIAIAGLIVVIAQAIGMEILDAYTIRKMLPRILIAAVAITLSWPLMNFAITLSNNLGFGVRDLILAPFHNLSTNVNFNFTGGLISNFFGGVIGVPIWMAAGGTGVLFSYVGTALVATLVAILVLTIRQIAIILLILLSPIALIAYVLPNTQRIFRLWWESFSKALLMFPLIVGFIAAGRVFSALALANTPSSGPDSILHGIIAFVAYFGPYLMIPLTFSMAGGMMNGIGGAIAQRGQGVQGMLSNYRKSQAQSRIQRARTEGLYRPGFGKFRLRPGGKQRSIGNALNTIGFWSVNADEMIPMKLGTTKAGKLLPGDKEGIPGFRRGGQAMMSQIKRAKRDQTTKAVQDLDIGYKSGRLMAGQFQYFYKSLDKNAKEELNDKFALRDANNEIMMKEDKDGNPIPVGWRAPDNWGERNTVADIIGTGSSTDAQEASAELRATASEFEKYTSSPETNRVDGRLLGMLSAAKSGRLELEDVADNHNRLLDEGDQESAVRETTMLQDALTGKRVSAARGHGLIWDKQGRAQSSYADPLSSKAGSSLMRINSQEIAGSKSEDLEALRETMVAHGSSYQMEMGENGMVRRKKVDGQDVLKQGEALERAEQVQARLRTLAQYNYGDSDVGVKVKDIWTRMGRKPEELVFGGGGSTDERAARDMAEAGHHEEPPPQPDQSA